MANIQENYTKYRWFFTTSGKLVVGGKNSEQNEELVNYIIKEGKEHIVMHTTSPGSPFSFILDDISKLTEKDLEETAIFTACFSQEWKRGKKKAKVDIFTSKQIKKEKGMKIGTFRVIGKSKSKNVELKLVLAVQNGKLRAVPFSTGHYKERILGYIIKPGKLSKKEAILKIYHQVNNDFSLEEIEQAIPSGGFC